MPDRYASLKQGLVGAWIPSVSGSGLLLPDLSGRGNNGVLTNMGPDDWVSGQYGRALDFDGVDDHIVIPSGSHFRFGNGTIDFPFTVSFWINKLNFTAGDFIGRNNVNASERLWRIILSGASDQFLFVLYDRDVNNLISAEVFPVTIDDGLWHHVCCTYSGDRQNTGLKIYFDGKEQSVTRLSSGTYVAMEDFDFPIWIGRVSNLYSSFMSDDTRIYNRELTPAEIRLLSSEPGIGLRQEKHRQTFYQFPSGAKRRLLLTGQT